MVYSPYWGSRYSTILVKYAVQGAKTLWILFRERPHAVLVMAHPRAELDVARSSVLAVRPFELVPQLQQLARSRPRLDAPRVTATANALLGSDARTPGTQVRR